jgi:hypothetical protein
LGEALSGLDDHAVKQRAVFLTDLATTSVRERTGVVGRPAMLVEEGY